MYHVRDGEDYQGLILYQGDGLVESYWLRESSQVKMAAFSVQYPSNAFYMKMRESLDQPTQHLI